VGKPYLAYAQRSWNLDDGRPLHAETGYWRCPSPGGVELVVAHPNGLVEVSEGTVRGSSISLTSRAVRRTTTAKDVSHIGRVIEVEGDHLSYRLDMAAVGVSSGQHLHAALQRVSSVA
jgi:THAP4-like, heme-binding beta-barrel domain